LFLDDSPSYPAGPETMKNDHAQPQSVSEMEEEIYRILLGSCERAFMKGVTSADIYETLKLMGEKAEANDRLEDGMIASFSWFLPCLWDTLVKLIELLRKVVWAIFVTLIGVVGVYCAATHFLNINLWPLTELYETRCLLPSHPILQELTRPVTNCSICQEYQAVKLIELNPNLIEFFFT